MRPAWSASSMIGSRVSACRSSSRPSSSASSSSSSSSRYSSDAAAASTARVSARASSRSASETLIAGATVASGMRALAEDRVQLVLEAARLDGAVHAALLRGVRLPPPATCPNGLALGDRLRAGRAADRGVALLVERMGRNLILTEVVPDLVLLPLGEWVELHDRAVVVVDLDLPDVGARCPLVAAEAGHPRVEVGERPRQWLHLADVAAEEPVLDRLEEEVRPVAVDEALHLSRVR